MQTYALRKEVPKVFFRAYDIRGKVDDGLDEHAVYTIARSIGTIAIERGVSTIIVGRDGRLSSPVLSRGLVQGLLDSGIDVINVGLVTSPQLYFATHTLVSQSGVMLTGSHNPKAYNGLKIVLEGQTLSEHAIQALYQGIVTGSFVQHSVGIEQHADVHTLYCQEISQRIQLTKPIRVVLDCGNGVAGAIAPRVFRQLGCDVITLYETVDGHFPNHHPNPSVAENLTDLIQTVQSSKADIGLAFDGDADRLGVVTNTGTIIWPDRQMMLFARDLLSRHAGERVVFDVKCSSLLAEDIAAHGGVPIMWRTGHSILKAKMIQEQALLAGEMSGHIFFKEDWYGFDDGIYAGARLLAILSTFDDSVDTVFARLPNAVNTPEILISVADNLKFNVVQALQADINIPGAEISMLDGVRVHFHDGWGLVRASNTTPALTLRFEGKTQASLSRIKRCVAEAINQVAPEVDVQILQDTLG